MIPKHISFDVLSKRITVRLGELLFPGIVLAVVALYYFDTRGLPDQSLLYADPLLYVTTALAVITIAQHGITLGEPDTPLVDNIDESASGSDTTSSGEKTETPETDDEDEDEDDSKPFFNRKTASLYVVVTTLYIIVLTSFSSYLTTETFVGATAVFLASVLILFGERRITRLVAYSIGFSLFIWAIFLNWLEVPLI